MFWMGCNDNVRIMAIIDEQQSLAVFMSIFDTEYFSVT